MARRLLMDGHQVVLLDIADFDPAEYQTLGEPLPEGWKGRLTSLKAMFATQKRLTKPLRVLMSSSTPLQRFRFGTA
jgi:hypothetical protein